MQRAHDRNMKLTLIIVAVVNLFLQKVSAEKRQFTCGFINDESSHESDAMQFIVNHTNAMSNVSISLEMFNASTEVSLFDQATAAFLQQNITVLIGGSQSKLSACALSTVTGIPLVRLHGNSMPFDQCQKTIDMSADYRYFAHATFDVLNSFNWKKISIIYDDDGRLTDAGYFYATFKNSQLDMNLVPISKHESSEDQSQAVLKAMEDIGKFNPEVILLYTSKEIIELLLQQVPYNLHIRYKWILQGQVPLNLTSLPNNVVLSFKLPYMSSSIPGHLKTAMQDKFKSNDKELSAIAYDAVQVVNRALNTEPCLSLNGSNNRQSDRNLMFYCMMKVNVTGLSGPVQFDENGKRTEIQLEILNLRNNSFKRIGTWNSTKRAILFENALPNEFQNSSVGKGLETRKFRIVFVQEPPYVMVKKNEDGVVSYEGYCVDLAKELARILKFKYELHPSADGKYGALTENGTWDGMVREILDGEAHMTIGPIATTESREKVIDFTIPFMYYTDDMILKKSSSEKAVDLLQFMNPFENNVWFCTLATLVIISVAVFVINYFSPYGYKDENGRGTSEEFSFFNSLWFALACMLQQGGDNTPRSLSGRVLTGCYWFCILIWVSTYTANLAAFLTVKNAAHPIKKLEDVLKTSHQVGVIASTSTQQSLKNTNYEPYKRIWQRMKKDQSFVKNTSHGMQLVREKPSFVFINDGPILEHIANQPPCDLMTVPAITRAKGLALGLQANDPHTMDFTLTILRLHENDFLDDLKRKWWDNANQCPQEENISLSQKRVDLLSMLGVYIVMGVGIVVAFMTLVAEIFWKRRTKEDTARMFRQRSIIPATGHDHDSCSTVDASPN